MDAADINHLMSALSMSIRGTTGCFRSFTFDISQRNFSSDRSHSQKERFSRYHL